MRKSLVIDDITSYEVYLLYDIDNYNTLLSEIHICIAFCVKEFMTI